MCGFCGFYGLGSSEEAPARIERMVRTLSRRGPDAEGIHLGEGVALGHRRLSILDLSETGAQPMSLQAPHVTITYNGEIYNFRELRRSLQAEGRVFRGRSDTEVILHAYAAWGLNGLRRLEGIFAFALWDEAARQLLLMRDRFGVKPLFYSRNGRSIAFGSEIKAVLAAGAVDRTIDPQALAEYFWYGNAFEDRTLYQAVRAVPPGHWMIVQDGAAQIAPWWRVEEWLQSRRAFQSVDEASVAVREALDNAVSRQLVSDVPVGIFLSGGVDSSAIAASAARASTQRLSSYSVGFDFDRGVNELPKARRVATLLDLDHHELRVSATDLQEVLLDLVRAHDEPFADAANIPLFLLARALRGTVKVVLQGDGGDEMFAGYRRYSMLRHAHMWQALPKFLSNVARATLGRRGERFARMSNATGASDPAMRMALLLTLETLHDPPIGVLQPDVRRELESASDPFLAYRRCAERFSARDPVQQMLLTDITLQLPAQFLAKVDRATMAQSIEARVPLLDERVTEIAVGMPTAYKVRGGQKKIVLREAMRGRLPDDVLDGPKTGFGVPYEHWLRSSLYDFATRSSTGG